MKCPFCNHPGSRVVDSRPWEDGTSIRRRRVCQVCRQRFTTYERVEELPLLVVKRDGSRQAFDKEKLLNSMLRAFEKRAVSMETLEEIADEIDLNLQNDARRQISTTQLGELVMQRLREVDEVAYIRFASVYRQFKDAGTFKEELEKLMEEETPAEPRHR